MSQLPQTMEELQALIQASIRPLQEENAMLREEMRNLREENAMLREENVRLREENARLQEENAKLREENARLREENANLQTQINAVRADINRIRDPVVRGGDNNKNDIDSIILIPNIRKIIKNVLMSLKSFLTTNHAGLVGFEISQCSKDL